MAFGVGSVEQFNVLSRYSEFQPFCNQSDQWHYFVDKAVLGSADLINCAWWGNWKRGPT